MNCPNCDQPVEAGAAFCGNCGRPLNPLSAPAPVAAAPAPGLPTYARATPAQHTGETKALLSVIFGIFGIAGALLMAVLGLVLGILGLVMGTMSRHSVRRGLSNAGLVFSSLAVLAGLAVWTYAIKHDPRFNQQSDTTKTTHLPAAPAVLSSDLTTPCYSTGFVDKLNISNHTGSCDMSAFNGPTINSSTDAYKIYADSSEVESQAAFMTLAKQALEKDISVNLSGFAVDSQQVGHFAGSPAYFVTASDHTNNIAVIEAAVLHEVKGGQNVFILVHAINAERADLSIMEAQWQWK